MRRHIPGLDEMLLAALIVTAIAVDAAQEGVRRMHPIAAIAGHVGLTLAVMAALVALAAGVEWATGRMDVATVLIAGLAGVWGYVMRERAQAEHAARTKFLTPNRWASNPHAARDVLWPLVAVLAVTVAVWWLR